MSTFHPDEINAIESRAQTEHKLDVMRRYYGQYPSIIAQSKSNKFDNSHIWLIDVFAGAGLHASANHPEGAVYGTAMLACVYARGVQRQFPKSQIHVRLVDVEENYCAKLTERTHRFRHEENNPVDVQVLCTDWADAIPQIVQEIQTVSPNSLSLWFIDPYGPTVLTFERLQTLLKTHGAEIIINLDATGLNRMRGVVQSPKAIYNAQVRDQASLHRGQLDAIYWSSYWEEPGTHLKVRPGMTLEDQLAEAYLLSFKRFRGHAYPLRSSDNQRRYLIHLSRSPYAEKTFRDTYEASLKVGLAKGKALTDTECGQHAKLLFDLYQGTEVSIEDLHEGQATALNRAQLRRVASYADAHQYGTFAGDTITWNAEPPAIPEMPTKKRKNQPQMDLFEI
jgi:three-Cys-motif partner protein